ncbi:hypothetical protein Nepgr_030411 [Nepenthes gracilis]|uniref:RRM domain-containing protein n=1 Tax=Nepenthes gracilis TaxID=150966 RepID=A0AAD3TGF8_NEPGR|nr:hypothetical protein Nepgr_030411 [Nepenthes gracilis]
MLNISRPARQGYRSDVSAIPSSNLWVGNLSNDVTDSDLMAVFGKLDAVDSIMHSSRNYAFIYFKRIEDAIIARDALQGYVIKGNPIRIEFAKPEQSDFHDMWDPQTRGMVALDPLRVPQEPLRNYSDPTLVGYKRQQPSQSFVELKEGQPSKVLWVRYPPSVVIDEKMLYNAMILYGEIERIKSFPTRNYSFVEFRSVEEATRAKESLQGRLFNNPRISIKFFSSELAPSQDLNPLYPALGGPMPDMYMNDISARLPHMDIFSHNHAIAPNNFVEAPPPSSIFAPGRLRPLGPRGGFDPLLPMPEFNDPMMLHNLPDFNLNGHMGLNRRGLSPPATGLLPSGALASGPLHKAMSSGWDVLDVSQIPRELKRSKLDGNASFNDASFVGLGQPHGGVQFGGSSLGPLSKFHGSNRFSPADVTVSEGHIEARTDNDYIWRGVIAKGGTPVCQSRCIPIGKGIQCELPEVVNCSARTGLDMLTKHYADAVGFEVVFFLPDSEDDFASYTEFLRYLGSRDRAVGPERLYGVVLKLPRVLNDASSQQHVPQSISSLHHMERQQDSLPHEYDIVHQKEQAMQMVNKVHDTSALHEKTPFPPTKSVTTTQSISQDPGNSSTASMPQAGVTLTPELIATLTSLLPANAQSLARHSTQLPLSTSTLGPSIPSSTPDRGTISQGWNQLRQDQTGQSPQQLGNQLNSQAPLLTNWRTPSVSNLSSQVLPESFQIQNLPSALPLQGAVSSRPLSTLQDTPQGQHLVASTQVTQQYQLDAPHDTQKGYGLAYGTAATGSYGLPDIQQSRNILPSSNEVPRTDFSYPDNVPHGPSGSANSQPLDQPSPPVTAAAVAVRLPFSVKFVRSWPCERRNRMLPITADESKFSSNRPQIQTPFSEFTRPLFIVVMDGIEAPSFELGLDLQLDSESLYQDLNSPMRETFLTPEDSEGFQLRVSESDVDALDDPVPTLRRLRRGRSSRSKSVSDQLSEQSPINADDDIEEFSSQDYARSEDEHLSVQQHSVCSSSKLSLIESGVLTRPAATETPCGKRNQTLNTPASLDASKDPMTFSSLTGSCFQRFQLLDSDSDDSPDCVCIDRDGFGIPFSKHTEANHGSFVPACVERSEPSVSKQRVTSKYFYPKKTSDVPTPAFDEFCEEYFGAAKDTKAAYDSVHGLCLAKLEGTSGGSKKMDQKDSCCALPPALSYFFHEDTRIQRLVRSRLPHFWPLASVDDTGFNQPNGSVIDYMTQFSNGDCPRQGGGAKVIVEKRPRRTLAEDVFMLMDNLPVTGILLKMERRYMSLLTDRSCQVGMPTDSIERKVEHGLQS